MDKENSSFNLTIVGAIALVAIVGLVALVMSEQPSSRFTDDRDSVDAAGADSQNLAGEAARKKKTTGGVIGGRPGEQELVVPENPWVMETPSASVPNPSAPGPTHPNCRGFSVETCYDNCIANAFYCRDSTDSGLQACDNELTRCEGDCYQLYRICNS